MTHQLPFFLARFTFATAAFFFLSMSCLKAQTCTTIAPGGEWGTNLFSCTGGATLATASDIIINHPVTISGQTITLNQQTAITLNSTLTFNKVGANDAQLILTNNSSTIYIASSGALVNGVGGNNNLVQIGSRQFTGNDFGAITAQRPVTLTANGLPVTLVGLKAIAAGQSVEISFSTASETNNSHFVVERSADARVFSEIGQVRGAGTTRDLQSYTFTDERPLAGANYYRLRQVDYDGAESFSPVVSVVFGKQDRITLAPSPATDLVRIHLEDAFRTDGLWQVYDNTGRQVLSGAWEAESTDDELDVNALPEGMYTFRLVVGVSVQVKRFRKM